MSRIRLVFSLCISVFIMVITGNVYAEIYRWVDKDGVVNFTQKKPADRDATVVRGSPQPRTLQSSVEENAPASIDQREEVSQLNLTADQQEMYEALKNTEAERQAEIERIRISNCKRSRALLARLTANSRISIRSSDGAERNLPDEERTRRIADVQQGIAINCDST